MPVQSGRGQWSLLSRLLTLFGEFQANAKHCLKKKIGGQPDSGGECF